MVSDLVLSVPHELLPVLVFLRSQLSWTATLLQKEYGIPVIADGGIKYSGDMTKALFAGANVCMMGSLFAGWDGAPGTFELYQGEENTKFTVVWALSPLWRTAKKDRYFQEGAKKLVPEGVEGRVAYKGTLEDTVFPDDRWYPFRYGLLRLPNDRRSERKRSVCQDLSAALRESHPHDIHITKEAPNYSIEE